MQARRGKETGEVSGRRENREEINREEDKNEREEKEMNREEDENEREEKERNREEDKNEMEEEAMKRKRVEESRPRGHSWIQREREGMNFHGIAVTTKTIRMGKRKRDRERGARSGELREEPGEAQRKATSKVIVSFLGE